MRGLLRPFMPPLWLIAYWYYCWAHREIRPDHPDVLKVILGRMKYAALLGIAPEAASPSDSPQHWNCRCAAAPLPPLPR